MRSSCHLTLLPPTCLLPTKVLLPGALPRLRSCCHLPLLPPTCLLPTKVLLLGAMSRFRSCCHLPLPYHQDNLVFVIFQSS